MVGNDRAMRLSNGLLSTARAQLAGSIAAAPVSVSHPVAACPSVVNVEQAAAGSDGERELLSYKNVVPSYREKPIPGVGDLYACPGCEDVFALAESLVDHLQRKAMLVTLPCVSCHRKRYFFNKCLAYAHVRQHFPDAAVPKLESLVMGASIMKYGMMPRSVAQELKQLEEIIETLVETRLYRQGGRIREAATSEMKGSSAGASVVTAIVSESMAVRAPALAAAVAVPGSKAIVASAVPRAQAVAGAAGHANRSPVVNAGGSSGGGSGNSLIVAAAAVASPSMPVRLFRCTECSEQFADQPNLQMHFGRPQRGVALTLRNVCAVQRCGKAFFSPCALKAHMRFHAGQRPFVCPECACVVPGDYTVFEKHVLFKCHHRSRLLEYSCALCFEAFDTLSRLQEHWLARPQHCLMANFDHLCKCSVCPVAFKSEELFSSHAATCRGAVAVHVYFCRGCSTLFRSYDELSAHNNATHRLDLGQKRPATASYLYRCEPCRAVAEAMATADSRAGYSSADVPKFKNLQAYDAHLQQDHGRSVITEMCDLCGVDFRTPEQLASHLEAVHSNGSGLIVCLKNTMAPLKTSTTALLSSSPAQKPADQGSKHSSVALAAVLASNRQLQRPASQQPVQGDTKATPHSTSSDVSRAASPQTSSAVATAQSLPFACHLCGRRFAAYVELREHSLDMHSGLGQLLECWLCNEKNVSHKSIHSWAMMDKHLMDVHKMTVDSCAVTAADQQQQQPTSDPLRRKVGPPDEVGGEEPLAKKKATSSFDTAGSDTERQCSRCGFSSRLRVEFVQHIKKHGAKGELCLECGMCFPVEAALRRHLFVAHRIQDMATYLRVHRPATVDDDAAGTASATSRSSASSTGGGSSSDIVASFVADSDGRCRVCSRQFETEAALRIHVRSHGLAFINAKRALNSNIKSGSSEDDSNDQASGNAVAP